MHTTRHDILIGDAREKLKEIPDGSVRCCVTSPPYWGLRDYQTGKWEGGDPNCQHAPISARGHGDIDPKKPDCPRAAEAARGCDPNKCRCGATKIDSQIGLERSIDEYVAALVCVFSEVRRVLADDGVAWCNIGDAYNAYNGGRGAAAGANKSHHEIMPHSPRGSGLTSKQLKSKDLIGLPWRVAFALQADGWYLRSDIIWHKRTPMPESVIDRPTRGHEYVFLLTKKPRYYYDYFAASERSVRSSSGNLHREMGVNAAHPHRGSSVPWEGDRRNWRSVWTLGPEPFSGAHFATMPTRLAEMCILAGSSEKGKCPSCGKAWTRKVERKKVTRERPNEYVKREGDEGTGNSCSNTVAGVGMTSVGWVSPCECGLDPVPDVVLDPFGGSGTTAIAARRNGRSAILIELNPGYAAMADRRIKHAMNPDTQPPVGDGDSQDPSQGSLF